MCGQSKLFAREGENVRLPVAHMVCNQVGKGRGTLGVGPGVSIRLQSAATTWGDAMCKEVNSEHSRRALLVPALRCHLQTPPVGGKPSLMTFR